MDVSFFQGVVGHQRVLRVLTQAAARPASAYLFHGPGGVGKTFIAERFAQYLLGCEPDRSLETHPDFMRLAREEDAKTISVEQARALIERLSLTSARGGYRVALVEQAHTLHESAANALLKVVEEPPPQTVFLFVSDRPERLPATLRSRLTGMPFDAIPLREQPDWMKQAHALAPEDLDRQRALLQTLLVASLGEKCAAIETLAKQMEMEPDPDAAWQKNIKGLMQQLPASMAAHPTESVRVGQGLVHAWRLAGSALSPRLALEFAAVKPYTKDACEIPSFLTIPYSLL